MRLGSCHLWGDDLGEFCNEIRLSGELGFEVIAIGDSPAGWHELYVSMMVAAREAPKAIIAPFVTSPFVRHPLVTANSLCSLANVIGDRVHLGLSTGGSNVMAIGHPPATQVQIRDYIQAVRQLLAGETATYEGRPVSALRHARRVPIYYSAFGPKALKLAGEKADGVIVFTNHDLGELDRKLEIVRAAALEAGRNPQDVDVWVTAFTSIRNSRAEAIGDLKAFIIVNGMAIRTPETMARVPEKYRASLQELHRRYDPTEHVVVGGKNARLLDELGLTEFLGNIDTVAGTATEVKRILDGLAERGVSTFIANMPGHADKTGTLHRLSQLMGLNPKEPRP
jgi:alkanesulfonate monooxygenase SsuD/methylene tetrahydromethanopterin reductase-like flavin-dependent oxidoreductase (luciferase family)